MPVTNSFLRVFPAMLRRFLLLHFPPLDWLASFGSWLRDLQMREIDRTTATEQFRRRIRAN